MSPIFLYGLSLEKNEYVGILTAEVDGVKYYFIDNEMYFWGGFKPYGDNALYEIEKFAFFLQGSIIHSADY